MSTNGQPTRLVRLEARYGLGGPCPCVAEVRIVGFDDDLVPPLPEYCERCGRRRSEVTVGDDRPGGPR